MFLKLQNYNFLELQAICFIFLFFFQTSILRFIVHLYAVSRIPKLSNMNNFTLI